jgi:hypothetical protein
MGRNNEKIKKHNDKLHKAQDKEVKLAEMLRKEKLKQISIKFNQSKTSENNI